MVPRLINVLGIFVFTFVSMIHSNTLFPVSLDLKMRRRLGPFMPLKTSRCYSLETTHELTGHHPSLLPDCFESELIHRRRYSFEHSCQWLHVGYLWNASKKRIHLRSALICCGQCLSPIEGECFPCERKLICVKIFFVLFSLIFACLFKKWNSSLKRRYVFDLYPY
jgi:hypothetical protein